MTHSRISVLNSAVVWQSCESPGGGQLAGPFGKRGGEGAGGIVTLIAFPHAMAQAAASVTDVFWYT